MPENLSGSSSGRKDLAEQEKQLLGNFWKYVQPMNLYKLLQQRHEISVRHVETLLPLNLTAYCCFYKAESATHLHAHQQFLRVQATYLRRNLTYHQQNAAAPCDR